VQVEFFLQHWADIRASDAMSNVWTQIRVGRHPGFEEGLQFLSYNGDRTDFLKVWPVIAQNLEFKPRMGNTADGLPAN
jgi:hypothetical protein